MVHTAMHMQAHVSTGTSEYLLKLSQLSQCIHVHGRLTALGVALTGCNVFSCHCILYMRRLYQSLPGIWCSRDRLAKPKGYLQG